MLYKWAFHRFLPSKCKWKIMTFQKDPFRKWLETTRQLCIVRAETERDLEASRQEGEKTDRCVNLRGCSATIAAMAATILPPATPPPPVAIRVVSHCWMPSCYCFLPTNCALSCHFHHVRRASRSPLSPTGRHIAARYSGGNCCLDKALFM